MRRIAIMNQKGGVGKTTTVANLGAALARDGWRALLVDLDPQAHLSLHYGINAGTQDIFTVYDVLHGTTKLEDAVVVISDHLSVLPAQVDLAGVEVELAHAPHRQTILRDALAQVQDRYDVVLFDCPPSLGILSINALVASFEVLIPLQPHFLALQGLVKLFQTVAMVRDRLNPHLRIGGVVVCMNEAGTLLAGEVVRELETILESARRSGAAWSDARLYQSQIRRNIKLAECPSHQVSIFDYAPKSNGAQDYRQLATEIFGVPQLEEKATSAPDSTARKARRPAPAS